MLEYLLDKKPEMVTIQCQVLRHYFSVMRSLSHYIGSFRGWSHVQSKTFRTNWHNFLGTRPLFKHAGQTGPVRSAPLHLGFLGKTALHIASGQGHLSTTKVLLLPEVLLLQMLGQNVVKRTCLSFRLADSCPRQLCASAPCAPFLLPERHTHSLHHRTYHVGQCSLPRTKEGHTALHEAALGGRH